MKYLYGYLVIVNALGLLLMQMDKKKAKKGAWRIPEKTLMLVAAVGGSVGALIGMRLFRHKTKHLIFVIGIPLLLILHMVVLIYLHM